MATKPLGDSDDGLRCPWFFMELAGLQNPPCFFCSNGILNEIKKIKHEINHPAILRIRF